MAIEQSQIFDFRTQDVAAFLHDKATTRYDEPQPTANANFRAIHEQELGGAEPPQSPTWVVRETYVVQRDGQHVSSFDVDVPITQPVSVTTIAVLYVRNDVAAPEALSAIKDAMSSYDPASGVDPHDWARSRMPADLQGGFGLFYTRQRARIEKTKNPIENDARRRAIRESFLKAYKEGFRVVKVGSVILDELAASPPSVYVKEVEDPTSIPAAETGINELVGQVSEGNCEGLEHWKKQIADLITIPEFKVAWELVEVTIGCVRVSLHLPVLYTRNATQVLWAFGAYPKDPFNLVEQIVTQCASLAAGAGIIVGLASANFIAAVKAFEAVFFECLKQKVKEAIQCVIPGLMILVRHDQWQTL